jgi:hypothetical protein
LQVIGFLKHEFANDQADHASFVVGIQKICEYPSSSVIVCEDECYSIRNAAQLGIYNEFMTLSCYHAAKSVHRVPHLLTQSSSRRRGRWFR